MNINSINDTKVTTNLVVLNFPHLLKVNKRSKFENSQAKYDATVIISKTDTETLSKIDNAIKKAIIKGGFSDTEKIKSPLKDGDVDYPCNNLYEGSMYMYVSTTLKPKVVDTKLNELPFYTTEIESGRYAKVSLYFEGYKSFDAGQCGISAKLLNVQVFPKNRLLELRSTPEDDFKIEESYCEDVYSEEA